MRFPSAGVPLSCRDLARGLAAHGAADFERALERFLAVRRVGCVSSGSAAFYIILKALAARSPRRAVIIPAYTAPVVVLPILKAGLRPVFADIALDTLNVDPESVAALAGPDTLAVVPVHMFGLPCDMNAVRSAAESAGAFVVEDAASALGARIGGRAAGTLGDIGFFSFHRGKQLTTLIGGAWATDREDLAQAVAAEAAALPQLSAVRSAALFVKLAALALAVRPAFYTALHPLLARYKDTVPHKDFPLFQFTAAQAGVGASLLARLPAIIAARNERAMRAREILAAAPAVSLPRIPPGSEPAFNHCPVLLPDRAARDRSLDAALGTGVECTTLYGKTVYQAYGLDPGECGGPCPRAEQMAERLLVIPCHPLVPIPRVERAAEAVARAVSQE